MKLFEMVGVLSDVRKSEAISHFGYQLGEL